MLVLSAAERDAVLAPFERARPLPARVYCEDAALDHERRTIFDRSWLCVGREEDVMHPGAWLRAPITEEGILVVRGVDLELRAFYNVCRHRATLLVDAPCGRSRQIACPYHGWTYELDGSLGSAPHAPAGFDRAAHGLHPARVGTWQGFVFVTLDEGAKSLADFLGNVPAWLADAPLASAKRAHRAEYDVMANWKLLVENFQESHHFTRIHPALERFTPNDGARSVIEGGRWLGGIMDIEEGAETVSVSGTRSGRPFLASAAHRTKVHDAMLFPALLTSLQPDYLLTYRLRPIEAQRTRVTAETYVHPAAMGPTFDPTDVVAFWERINDEDRAICERQQIGMRSRAYVPSRYAAVEDGVHAFDRMVALAYGNGSET